MANFVSLAESWSVTLTECVANVNCIWSHKWADLVYYLLKEIL